jgi:hypothetical protein
MSKTDLNHYQNVIGKDFGAVLYYTLAEWTQAEGMKLRYENLFMGDVRKRELMNKCDAGFFGSVQIAYWQFCTLAICRLSDPQEQGRPRKPKKNITVFAMSDLAKTDRQKHRFEELLAVVKTECAPHRDWRNQRYAHYDYNVRFGNVEPLKPTDLDHLERALHSIYAVLAYVHEEWFDTHLAETVISPASNIQYLIHDAVTYQEIRLKEAKIDFTKALNWYPDWLYK